MPLRQSYARVAKRATVMAGRYAHAKQFKRMNRQIKLLRTRLGRLIRDIRRKIDGHAELEMAFAGALSKASQIRRAEAAPTRLEALFLARPRDRVHRQGQGQHKPYEFGVKVSLTTTNRRCKGGQFILHAKALPGNPYDGHTLRDRDRGNPGAHRAARSNGSMSTRATGATARRNRSGSSNPGQKRGVHGQIKTRTPAHDPPSRPSSVTAKPTATWTETSCTAVTSATGSTPS